MVASCALSRGVTVIVFNGHGMHILMLQRDSINVMMQPPEKSQWPELVGKTGEEAKAALLAENPKLRVFTILPNQPVTLDYRLDRVRIPVDENGIVIRAPALG